MNAVVTSRHVNSSRPLAVNEIPKLCFFLRTNSGCTGWRLLSVGVLVTQPRWTTLPAAVVVDLSSRVFRDPLLTSGVPLMQ